MSNYIIKLNGKTISKRKVRNKTCTLKILHNIKTGVFKSVDCFKNNRTPIRLVNNNDNENVIYYDWATFDKVDNDFIDNFTYSKNQQMIDLKKKELKNSRLC